MERLYTERQWRAIQEIERLSEGRMRSQYMPPEVWRKRLSGPTFVGGEFILVKSWTSYGIAPWPQAPLFRVLELNACLSLTYNSKYKDLVVAAARRRILDVGEHWPEYLVAAQAEMAEWRAKNAAQEAIYNAKKAPKPRKIGKRARAVFEASEGKCHYCKTVLTLDGKWHIEHKFPRALFGGSEQSNLAASCTKCNHRKRDKTDLEFQALIAQTVEVS